MTVIALISYMKRNKMSLRWSVRVGITHPGWVWECSGLTITPVSWWHHSITIWRVSISQTIQQPRQQASSSPPPRSSILLLSLHNSSPIETSMYVYIDILLIKYNGHLNMVSPTENVTLVRKDLYLQWAVSRILTLKCKELYLGCALNKENSLSKASICQNGRTLPPSHNVKSSGLQLFNNPPPQISETSAGLC